MVTIKLPKGEWDYDDTAPLAPKGGFGQVFPGSGPGHSSVAIKLLALDAASAAHREVQIGDFLVDRGLSNVIPVYDAGQDASSDRYYIVMARACRSLQDELRSRGVLPVDEAIQVLLAIADGLGEVSELVHRDLKPANILLEDRRWKVADFGIAKFVEDSTSLETLRGCLTSQYAAPEQWKREAPTSAIDVYALACIAHALINGRPPFDGPDYEKQHLTGNPPPLKCDDSRLRGVVSLMLRKRPEGRPPLERFRRVLQNIIATPVPGGVGLAALHQAGAEEAHKQASSEASAAAKEQERQDRNQLADDATRWFVELIQAFSTAASVRSKARPREYKDVHRGILRPAALGI